MIKRLLIAALCMFAVPILTSTSRSHDYPFPNATAIAGHTMGGAYCDCGTPDCICDAVEAPPAPVRPKFYQTEVGGQPDSLDPTPEPESDLGVELLFGALLLALLLRILN